MREQRDQLRQRAKAAMDRGDGSLEYVSPETVLALLDAEAERDRLKLAIAEAIRMAGDLDG